MPAKIDVDEQFGKLEMATDDERVEAARRLATQLQEKVKGYTYRLKTQSGKDKKTGADKLWVNLYINGKAGVRPGRIGIGDYATPIVWPGENESDTEAFVNAVDAAGIRLKVYSPSAE